MVWVKEFPGWLRTSLILVSFLVVAGLFALQVKIALPNTPAIANTLTPQTKATPSQIGSYDRLGKTIAADQATQLLQTEAGRAELAPEAGAVAVTQELIDLGRRVFYEETFGGQRFQTDIVGALNGPINLVTITQAIARLAGKHTSNLQIPINRDVTIGGREFKAGTLLNTGMDVPANSLLPLGMRPSIDHGKVRVGITCALCHATIDPANGKVLEGAPNIDVNTGLVLAFASNSAAMFRQTDINPTRFPVGDHTYTRADGQVDRLPDSKAIEEAVDAALLSWPPGNFDSSGTLVNNPSQIPSSYTFEAYPYGWSGHSAIGWFHGLTTLNSNVHATNSDATTGADGSQALLGIDKDTYLGVILQNAANPQFRLPEAANPSAFFQQQDPTPGEPAINEVIRMPGYPKGSPFMLDGLMASSPGYPVGQQLNAISVWQNTLAPPPNQNPALQDRETLQQGAELFNRAGCAECHSGRYFTNHRVISQTQVGTQPSRAPTLKPMALSFVEPTTYPASTPVPLPENPLVLPVPTDVVPAEDLQRAFGLQDRAGGYKVPSLIGLQVTAPYLHDGGVAASQAALKPTEQGFTIADASQLGIAGTLLQGILPDPEASLRVLLDRQLREGTIAANRAHPDLQRSNVDGSGHAYWVDRKAGFSSEEQTYLIQFLLSLDDDPLVLP